MCSVGSLTCGILSLVLPLIALARRKNALPFAAISMGLCSLALLGQIFEYNVRVYAQDFSALLDTSFAIRFCAVVLFLLWIMKMLTGIDFNLPKRKSTE